MASGTTSLPVRGTFGKTMRTDAWWVQPAAVFLGLGFFVGYLNWAAFQGEHQSDVERVQEFRKCIECYLCQDVCHVLREHHMHDEFIGPRFLVYNAALEMHSLDTEDRREDLRKSQGIGLPGVRSPKKTRPARDRASEGMNC